MREPGTATSTATGWYAQIGRQTSGPHTWDELYRLAQHGRLRSRDHVCHPSLPQWVLAAQIPGLIQGVSPKRRAWLLPTLIAAVVVVLGGVGGGLFWALGGQEGTADGVTASSTTLSPGGTFTGTGTAGMEPVTVQREPGPQAVQTANAATALALKYYVYARLKTEEYVAADFRSMPEGAFEDLTDELVVSWETADALASKANAIVDQAVLLLETSSAAQNVALYQARFQHVALISRDIDPETWAENLTKEYDALRGAQRYQQLAQQLGTDTKTAVEQMALAQKIIHNIADREEAQAEVDAYTRSINIAEGYKTGSKVGLFLGAAVATGGGSLASCASASVGLAKTGALVVGGVDCIVSVGETTSAIVLGENHQVTVDFQKAADIMQPVSMVVGLVTLDPTETEEHIALVGEAIMEWFYPSSIMALGIEPAKAGGTRMIARIVDTAEKDITGIRSALEMIGLSLPTEAGISVSDLRKAYSVNAETTLASMERLASQIAEMNVAEEPREDSTGSITGHEGATGAITAPEMAGTWSGTATRQYIAKDVEGPKSLAVTMNLGENGTGTATVEGYSGEAWYGGSTIGFSIAMKDDGMIVSCQFTGTVTRGSGGIVVSGDVSLSAMGVEFASYALMASK